MCTLFASSQPPPRKNPGCPSAFGYVWVLARCSRCLLYTSSFKNLFRLEKDEFNFLLKAVDPSLRKENTNMREAIPPNIKLEITLRYLASGESYSSRMYLFRAQKIQSRSLFQTSVMLYKRPWNLIYM